MNDNLCRRINFEFSKVKNPTFKDLQKLSKKFDVEIFIVRDCIGLKDQYDFLFNEDQK